MTTEVRTRKTLVSLWIPIAVLIFGLLFLVFIFVEYQRNIALVEQNRTLIAGSARAGLTNSILSRDTNPNWASIQGSYGWIKDAPHTYWFDNGRQDFPWRRATLYAEKANGKNWQTLWSALNSPSLNNDVIDSQRLTLLNAIHSALETDDKSSIQRSFDAYLEHKNAYRLSPKEEIAFSLKLVEIGAQAHWSSELVHAILITGGTSKAPIIRPVVDLLFRHIDLFSDKEINLILPKVRQQLEMFNLSAYFLEDYLSHLTNPRFSSPPNSTQFNSNLGVVTDDDWLLQRVSETGISAEPFRLAEEIQLIEQEFIELGVLDEGDSLTLIKFAGSTPIEKIVVQVEKAQLNSDKRNQTAFLVIKSLMLIAFVTLVLLTLRLIEKSQQRRIEYLSLREDFVKLVSHELKTPLAGIRAMAETLRKRVERDLGVESYPERIISEADKLWYMVDNILGFNRVQLNEAVIDQQPTKLKILCNKVVDDVRSFSANPYSVNNMIHESVEAYLDSELFSLVVKNIIVNAGLYNENSTIEVTLTYDEKSHCLFLSDNGVGIAEEDRQNIFKPFVRLSQSVRRSGTGLGLAICKRIMQLHNGDLTLFQSSQRGSVWKISLAE